MMVLRWNSPFAQLIVPSLDGNEDLKIFYAVLPDEPEKPGRGCAAFYVCNANGEIALDKGAPVTKTVDGMTSWRVKPEYAEVLPAILEFYAYQHG